MKSLKCEMCGHEANISDEAFEEIMSTTTAEEYVPICQDCLEEHDLMPAIQEMGSEHRHIVVDNEGNRVPDGLAEIVTALKSAMKHGKLEVQDVVGRSQAYGTGMIDAFFWAASHPEETQEITKILSSPNADPGDIRAISATLGMASGIFMGHGAEPNKWKDESMTMAMVEQVGFCKIKTGDECVFRPYTKTINAANRRDFIACKDMLDVMDAGLDLE